MQLSSVQGCASGKRGAGCQQGGKCVKAGKVRLCARRCMGCATHMHGILHTCKGCVSGRSFQHILWNPSSLFLSSYKFLSQAVWPQVCGIFPEWKRILIMSQNHRKCNNLDFKYSDPVILTRPGKKINGADWRGRFMACKTRPGFISRTK